MMRYDRLMVASRSKSRSERPTKAPDRLLSAQDLADYLELPVATIYAWRYRGQGPRGFRAGRHLRYRWLDVERWISGQLEQKTLD
jgi:predicted DNA-binding transcriptional regulator AlpA